MNELICNVFIILTIVYLIGWYIWYFKQLTKNT